MSVIDAVILLLNSNSKDIVYYSLGALINLMTSEEIKYYFLFFIFAGCPTGTK